MSRLRGLAGLAGLPGLLVASLSCPRPARPALRASARILSWKLRESCAAAFRLRMRSSSLSARSRPAARVSNVSNCCAVSVFRRFMCGFVSPALRALTLDKATFPGWSILRELSAGFQGARLLGLLSLSRSRRSRSMVRFRRSEESVGFTKVGPSSFSHCQPGRMASLVKAGKARSKRKRFARPSRKQIRCSAFVCSCADADCSSRAASFDEILLLERGGAKMPTKYVFEILPVLPCRGRHGRDMVGMVGGSFRFDGERTGGSTRSCTRKTFEELAAK